MAPKQRSKSAKMERGREEREIEIVLFKMQFQLKQILKQDKSSHSIYCNLQSSIFVRFKKQIEKIQFNLLQKLHSKS